MMVTDCRTISNRCVYCVEYGTEGVVNRCKAQFVQKLISLKKFSTKAP